MYDAAEILLPTNLPTNKAILGVGLYIIYYNISILYCKKHHNTIHTLISPPPAPPSDNQNGLGHHSIHLPHQSRCYILYYITYTSIEKILIKSVKGIICTTSLRRCPFKWVKVAKTIWAVGQLVIKSGQSGHFR